MDIPDLDELEWLESHTLDDHIDDDFAVEIEPPSSPETDNPPKRSTLTLPPKPSPFKINQAPKKRSRYDTESTSLGADYSDEVGKNGICAKTSRTEAGQGRNVERALLECPYFDTMGVNDGTSAPVDAAEVLLSANEGRWEDSEACENDREWHGHSPRPDTVEELEAVQGDREERTLSRYATEIEGDCVPITGLDGERVYAKLCRIESDEWERKKNLSVRGDLKGLLQQPVRVLMQKVENDELTRALQASVHDSTHAATPKASLTNEQLWVDKYSPSSFTELLSDDQTNREVLLWLKQWDSCVFGSEIKSTKDDVLFALRRHSSGSQHPKQFKNNYFDHHGEARLSRGTFRAHNESNKESNNSQGLPETWEKKYVTSGPPEQKILLLCGPPGLGKTTLAHVSARHCGYRVVEINASDDRSSSTIETKIHDVVQMNSVTADSKPKCLVIDEIDGALGDGKGAVDVILQLVAAERKGENGKENVVHVANTGRKSSRERRSSSLLQRPVICICNDLYAPALRPLRQVAKVHIFVQPTVSRVVNRLKYICNREGVKTSSIALTALAEYTECDIRSCLNTLQFLHKKKQVLNVMEISSQVVGRKDASKSVFDIWKEIFQKRKGRKARRSNDSGGSRMNDLEFLYSIISNHGDFDLIFNGIYENILQLRYVDQLMQKTVQCLDNLVVSDITTRNIMRTQQMSLLVYLPPLAILIHALIAQLERKEIEWPKSLHRHRNILAERIDMFHTWHNRISPCISRHLSVKSFVEDSVSLMLHILSPPMLRPVAPHLLSDSEKSDLNQLVNSMVSYSMTYKTIKSGQPANLRDANALNVTTLSLDPPLTEYICFKDYNSCHFDLAFVVKQVLVHEVEKQKIMLSSLSKSSNLNVKENQALEKKNGPGTVPSSSHINGSGEKKKSGKDPGTGKFENFDSPSMMVAETGCSTVIHKVKSVAKTKRHSGDLTSFFSRTSKVSNEGSQICNNTEQRPGKMQRDSHPLLFKFNEGYYTVKDYMVDPLVKVRQSLPVSLYPAHQCGLFVVEGYTNAVKRPVRMREFIL